MKKAPLLTIFLIVFIDLIGFGILLPNQQYYGETLGIHNAFYLTLIGPAYSFFQFVFAPILGAWSDRVGRRPVLIISQVGTLAGFLMLFSCHLAIGASAPLAIALLYGSRVLDGISGGNISIASAYIADITTPENRAKGYGVIGAAFGIGFIFGPAIGGLVGKHFGLAWVPIVAAVFSLTALILTIFRLPESLPGDARTHSHRKTLAEKEDDKIALKPLEAESPEIRPAAQVRRFSLTGLRHALARPVIGALIIMSFVNGFAFAGMEQTFSLLLQERAFPVAPAAIAQYNASTQAHATTNPTEKSPQVLSAENASGASGYLFCGIGLIIAIVQGGLIGRLVKAFGEAALTGVGPILIGIGLFTVGRAGSLIGVWPDFILGSMFMAFGSSIFNPSVQSLISRHANPNEQGEILGAAQGMSSLARAVGPMLAGYLFWRISSTMPYNVSAAICLLVAIGTLGMGHRLQPPAVPPEEPGFPVEPTKPNA
ncbi:MAG TPA: MFS transporter [Phycisphaerae bacterium]|nr:MFS transporter [Phycisphaerae bacterium]